MEVIDDIPLHRKLGSAFDVSLNGKVVRATCEGRNSRSWSLLNIGGEHYMERGQQLVRLEDHNRCPGCGGFQCSCNESSVKYKPKPTIEKQDIMIKLSAKIGTAIRVEVNGKDAKECISAIGFFSELNARCGGECGLCNSEAISFRHRVHDENDFYELGCDDCGGQYAIGQRKDGNLYPRGDKETGGWNKFERSAPKRDPDDRRSSKPAPRQSSTADNGDW